MPRFSCVTLGCASLLGEIRYSAVPDRGPYAWHGLALEYRKARHGSKPKDFDEWKNETERHYQFQMEAVMEAEAESQLHAQQAQA